MNQFHRPPLCQRWRIEFRACVSRDNTPLQSQTGRLVGIQDGARILHSGWNLYRCVL